MGGILLDFTAAFDIVVYKSLLKMVGFTQSQLSWIESYLFSRKQLICFTGSDSGVASSELSNASGSLPQAVDIYTVFTNGLPLALNKAKISMYADHSTINRKCTKQSSACCA